MSGIFHNLREYQKVQHIIREGNVQITPPLTEEEKEGGSHALSRKSEIGEAAYVRGSYKKGDGKDGYQRWRYR